MILPNTKNSPHIQKAHYKGKKEMLKYGLCMCATYMSVPEMFVYFQACACLLLTSEIKDRMGRISWTEASWLKTNDASSGYTFWLLYGLPPPSPYKIETNTLIVTKDWKESSFHYPNYQLVNLLSKWTRIN